MPWIQLKSTEILAPTEKTEIVSKFTNAMAIEGKNMRPVTWVSIEEICSGEWSIGGQVITTNDVRVLAAWARNKTNTLEAA